MIRLSQAASAWGTSAFERVLKYELEALPPRTLPLQAGLAHSSYVPDIQTISAMVIDAREYANGVRVKVGIFYKGILGGCACADDPTPTNENNEYCVLQLDIDRTSGETIAMLLKE